MRYPGDGNYLGSIGDAAVDDIERRNHHCYREKIDDADVFICGELGPPCMCCGAVSEVLCDFPLPDGGGKTCDAALCLRCAPTIGSDKNYCPIHAELGPGLVAFPLQPRMAERPACIEHAALPGKKVMRRRLPKAPPPEKRWRVLSAEGIVLTTWLPEISARQAARERAGRVVETWDDFVAWHRRTYPRAPRKPRTR